MKIAFISDIHEDYYALKVALKQIERKNCDMIICLGDILGFDESYYNFVDQRNASSCVKAVKENCSYALIGNHDLFAIKKTPGSIASFTYPDNFYEISLLARKSIAEENNLWFYDDSDMQANLDDSDLNYLYSLPESMVLCMASKKLFLSHFIYPDLTGSTRFFPERKNDFNAHFSLMEEKEVNYAICGHGHFEGYSLTGKDDFQFRPYEVKKIVQKPFIITLPCITRGKRKNGFAVLQIPDMIIEVIAL